LTAGFVFLVLFPEQASDKLIERLDKLLRTVLNFGQQVTERRVTEKGITAIDRRLSTHLLDVLNMADQARLEGQRGAINSVAAIEAAYTLARIGYRFEVIARGRIAEPKVLQTEQLSEREVAFEQACCAALEMQIAKLEPSDSPEHLAQTSPTPTIDLGPISDELAAAQNTLLPPDEQILLTAQLESYRRLPILLSSLDTSLQELRLR